MMPKKLPVTSAKNRRKLEDLDFDLRKSESEISYSRTRRDSCAKQLFELGEGSTSDHERLQKWINQYGADLSNAISEKEGLETKRRELEVEIPNALDDFLSSANGKAVTHTLDASYVIALAKDVEQAMEDKGVLVKNRIGAEFEYRPAGKVANASYARKAGPQITTFVKLVRVTDGWRLVEAERDHAWCNQKEHWHLKVSEAARADIVATALKGISVRPKEAA